MRVRVRVTETYEVDVEAEYGDDVFSLVAKGLGADRPKNVDRDAVVLPRTKKGDDREE